MCRNSNIFSVFTIALLFFTTQQATASDSPAEGGKYCPKICTCDIVEELKRADCSNEKLINTYTDVPHNVEILDLSINIISSIENDNFKHYDNLVKLFLSENSIQTISLDAFSNQRRMTTLDLSHNRLEHLNEQLFERNELLVDLNLSNNNFMMLPDRPFLKSYSITFLHLADCRIPHISDTMFIDLPNLQWLDLTKNIMNSLSKTPFGHLRRLNSIFLNDNRWNCKSEAVRSTVKWMKNRIPMVTVESCLLVDASFHGNKFERIQEDPFMAAKKDDRVDVAIEQVWGTGSPRSQAPQPDPNLWPELMNWTCSYGDAGSEQSTESCEQFLQCQRKYGDLYHAYKQLLPRKHIQSSSYIRNGTFLGGMLVGMLFGSFTTYTIYWMVRCCRKRAAQKKANQPPDQKRLQRELHREIRDRNRFEHSRLNESPVLSRSERFPGPTSQQNTIYQNHEQTRQFLVKLFSKRNPRYVRSNSQLINMNNRYVPPIQTRETQPDPSVSPNVIRPISYPEELWAEQNMANNEREQMLQNNPEQPTWISIRPTSPGTLLRSSRMGERLPASNESPPPTYVECTLNMTPTEERVSMY
ncbi:leucine-rich repeat-containing G-protein coupled receptor 5-like [Anopheles nili]|uniref:leucine-rich repeat-containing G-protein coupled receptor 5-like n=1 Tax=Anopheles nili TaxID=185578 RepID=UPI00237ADB11|nr:leucine-rich repeat-containing G-protein coupled receptor 5-like [Anopheles nili]